MEKKIVVCDKCDKDISNENFYISNIFFKIDGKNTEHGRKISNGDYCEECFKKILKDEFNFN